MESYRCKQERAESGDEEAVECKVMEVKDSVKTNKVGR